MAKPKPKQHQQELHNKLAGDIVRSIVKPVLESNGDPVDVLILLESVVVGTLKVVQALGVPEERALEILTDRVQERLSALPDPKLPSVN